MNIKQHLCFDILTQISKGAKPVTGVGVGRTNDMTTEQTVVDCWNVLQVVIMNMRLDTQPANIPRAPVFIYCCIECPVVT